MKNRKKVWFKKVCLVLAGLAVLIVFFILLLLYRPGRYSPPELTNDRQVSPYLTHELLPKLYNDSQLGEPFDLFISQDGVNEIIAHSKWPRQSGGIDFSAPVVFFVPGWVVLMGEGGVGGAEFVVSVVVEPEFDGGLLYLRLAKVKVGAVNITPLARVIGRRMYAERIADKGIDTKDLRAQIAASLLNDEGFEPVFKVEDRRVRVEDVVIEQEKMSIRLVPVLEGEF
ncbi:MAG: hypothetical protein ACYS18_12900 [Planctomycetota bacterium]